jgi:integrase
MAARRAAGSAYFEHSGECRDQRHRSCAGRWRGELVVQRGGKRYRRRVTGQTKSDVHDQLEVIRTEVGAGVRTSRTYTVDRTVADWIDSLDRADKTISTINEIVAPLLDEIGEPPLRDLEADDVLQGLRTMAKTHATRTVRDARANLERAVKFAQARGKIGRNVVSLVKPPKGKAPGRPSKSLTVLQARSLIRAAEDDALMLAHILLGLGSGVRTEEARALMWEDCHLDDEAPWISVTRSVRVSGDAKNRTSRRALVLPERVAQPLLAHAEKSGRDSGLVFCTRTGKPLAAGNVRRSFRRLCRKAGLGEEWTPRELRPTYASMMSDEGVPIEQIGRLMGHAGGSTVTERIYRKQINPRPISGSEAINDLLRPARRVVRRDRATEQ